MSGHSKWNNIKRTKEKSDAQKGKIFTKLGRELAVIVRAGGADPSTNNKLKDAILKAKQANMPNDTIERSIKKAAGDMSGVNYVDTTYEGYGVAGSAVIVECLTDNKNRTAGDVRHYFDKFGGSMGSSGCVSYLFKRKGTLVIEKTTHTDVDTVMMDALEAGAKDVVDCDDVIEIETSTDDYDSVMSEMQKQGYTFASSEIGLVPDNYIELEPEKEKTFLMMIDKLEELDDVQNVYHNVNLSDNDYDEE